MKDFYNLESIVDLTNFPWEEVYVGISKSKKNASIFYGHGNDEATGLGLTPEQGTWFNSLKYGAPLKGIDILLTHPLQWPGNWYRLDMADFWKPAQDMVYFPKLQEWIKNSNIFSGTGRQIFFIQMQHQCTPPHIDQDITKIPPGFSHEREFLWVTPPENGKKLLVNGVQTGHVTWFNNYQEHQTLPEPEVRWSLRIDGKFTDEFKRKISQL